MFTPSLKTRKGTFRAMDRNHFFTGFLLMICVMSAYGQTDPIQVVPPSLLPEILALSGDLETIQKPKYLSPEDMVVSPDKQSIYIAEQTAKQVVRLDCATNRVTQTMLMPNEPTGLAVSSDGVTLYITCASQRWPSGMVCVVNAASGKVQNRIAVGHMARSPVLSPDQKTLYVCNWYSNDVSVVDVASGTETAKVPVTREPYAAAITPDGATLVVTNALPDQKATDTTAIACKIALINTTTKSVRATIPLPVGSHSLYGLCITPDGKFAFATHLIGRFTIPATTLTGGWVHSNNMAIVDIPNAKLTNDIELDNSTQGFANPWGVGITGDAKYVCVLHAGSNSMTVVDYAQLLVKAQAGTDLSHDFTSIYSIKNSIYLTTKGSRALAMVDNKAYAAGYYSDSLEVVTINGLTSYTTAGCALGPSKPMNGERQGEFNFTDATLCYQQWQSCFSCHPFTRPDALNWILNTTNSTPKNVKSMLYSWWTPPTSWAGKRPAAGGIDGSVYSGISAELGLVPTDAEANPLDTLLMFLKPIPSPHLVKGRLSASAVRGKAIFTQVGCNICHPAPLYTNQRFENVGVVDPFDANTQWDTPSLNEAWRTSPYGHLGSYNNLSDILILPSHSLGASKLSPQDLSDLIEFVLSL
jgi:YVTN family beta-propeller protein